MLPLWFESRTSEASSHTKAATFFCKGGPLLGQKLLIFFSDFQCQTLKDSCTLFAIFKLIGLKLQLWECCINLSLVCLLPAKRCYICIQLFSICLHISVCSQILFKFCAYLHDLSVSGPLDFGLIIQILDQVPGTKTKVIHPYYHCNNQAVNQNQSRGKGRLICYKSHHRTCCTSIL